MSEPEIEFIGWHKSALELVSMRLERMAEEETETFRRATVVVPTAESGRKLRERMADAAGRPILMPRMQLPGQLIGKCGDSVASDLETLATWVDLLMADDTETIDRQKFFPRPEHPEQAETWAVDIAARLMRLRQQMEQYDVTTEGLLHCVAVRKGLPQDFIERWDSLQSDEECRWRELQKLFDAVDHRLEKEGKMPAHQAHECFITQAAQGKNTQIILACLPELSAQMRRYLLNYAGSVRILVNAPPELSAGFDTFGCVRPDYWAERELPSGVLTEENIVVTSSAQRLAQAAVKAVGEQGVGTGDVVLGVCDASFTPVLVTEFGRHGWHVNMPKGRAFQTSDLAALPTVLKAACCAGEGLPMTVAEPLLRNTAAQRLIGGNAFDSYGFGLLLDRIITHYLPDNIDRLLSYINPDNLLPGDGHDVKEITELRTLKFYETAHQLCELVRKSQKDIRYCLRLLVEHLCGFYQDETLGAAAHKMAQNAKELEIFLQQHPCPEPRARVIMQCILTDRHAYITGSTQRNTHLDALGWRELAFADGELMLLTGLHGNSIPEPLPEDPFLPDTLRQALGMPCLRSREARDCYLLCSVLSRENVRQGKVRIILSRSSADGQGSPVEPSRLLYHCKDEELVARVRHLYQEDLPPEKVKSYSRDWSLAQPGAQTTDGAMESVTKQIAPEWNNPFARAEHCFTPSEISSFLACPLRFWMKQALGVSPWDTYPEDKMEADSAQYGNLVHSVLRYVGETYCTKEKLIAFENIYRKTKNKAWQLAHAMYGSRALPRLVQMQLVRFCNGGLRTFLRWHSKQIAEDGWECVGCEYSVKNRRVPLPDGSTAYINMRLDRIDYNPATKQWRIIDYKTHGRNPFEDHLEKVPKAELFREKMGEEHFPLFGILRGGRTNTQPVPHRWKDVQLPMYVQWLMQAKGCKLPEAGYYNLPYGGRAASGYNAFADLDAAALKNAMVWVANAILLMRAGKCLYSAESFGCRGDGSFSENSDFADPRRLFHTLKPLDTSAK